ncbi:MAG: hypothetical protein AMXMBFR31_07070 [Candidatus Desulfobacillus denitrificans]
MSAMRSDFYVYFHRDGEGSIFYVGKGTDRRAWSTDRHPVWHKYVAERLGGTYSVEIHQDGLTESEAEALEERLIAKLGEQLVNWINPSRQFDYQALETYHRLRDANRRYVEDTKPIEVSDPEAAVERYRTAMTRMRGYEAMTLERGLISELGGGPDWGDPNILNRLTLCLQKLGRYSEMISEANQYFSEFPSARNMSIGKQVIARVVKARTKVEKRDA